MKYVWLLPVGESTEEWSCYLNKKQCWKTTYYMIFESILTYTLSILFNYCKAMSHPGFDKTTRKKLFFFTFYFDVCVHHISWPSLNTIFTYTRSENLSEQVVMQHATAAWRPLLLCQNLGRHTPILPTHFCYPCLIYLCCHLECLLRLYGDALAIPVN